MQFIHEFYLQALFVFPDKNQESSGFQSTHLADYKPLRYILVLLAHVVLFLVANFATAYNWKGSGGLDFLCSASSMLW